MKSSEESLVKATEWLYSIIKVLVVSFSLKSGNPWREKSLQRFTLSSSCVFTYAVAEGMQEVKIHILNDHQ